MENLSGYSLDDVKVHYNSDKPAQLQAHAYAQGTNIHLASGQEKHLAHEAWHVVQQKQGRVKPTLQMKGKVNINDDSGLEKEADIMGAKALQMQTANPIINKHNSNKTQQGRIDKSITSENGPIQRVATDFKTYNQIVAMSLTAFIDYEKESQMDWANTTDPTFTKARKTVIWNVVSFGRSIVKPDLFTNITVQQIINNLGASSDILKNYGNMNLVNPLPVAGIQDALTYGRYIIALTELLHRIKMLLIPFTYFKASTNYCMSFSYDILIIRLFCKY